MTLPLHNPNLIVGIRDDPPLPVRKVDHNTIIAGILKDCTDVVAPRITQKLIDAFLPFDRIPGDERALQANSDTKAHVTVLQIRMVRRVESLSPAHVERRPRDAYTLLNDTGRRLAGCPVHDNLSHERSTEPGRNIIPPDEMGWERSATLGHYNPT